MSLILFYHQQPQLVYGECIANPFILSYNMIGDCRGDIMNNLTYRLLDGNNILRRCLHRGPVPLTEVHPEFTSPVEVETRANVHAGTGAHFL